MLYASDWFSYAGGVFAGCATSPRPFRNHAVLLVGYDLMGNWIIKNSWGASWGDRGYITLSAERNCGITDATEFHYQASTIPSTTSKVRYYFRILSNNQTIGGGNYRYQIRQDGKSMTSSPLGNGFTSGSYSQFYYPQLYQGYEAEVHVQSVQANMKRLTGFQLWDQYGRHVKTYSPGQWLEVDDVPFVFCAGC